MGQRVTPELVEEIFDNPDSIPLTPFIIAASVMVDKIEAIGELTTQHLTEIERWLAAHFASIHSDGRGEHRIEIGGADTTFEGKYDLGLDFTRYGQQVKMLDTTGALATVGRPRAKFSVVSRGETPDN